MTLQADLAALDRASRLIGEISRSIDKEQTKLRRQVDDLLAASWNGVAADQFAGAWSQWRQGMAEILTGLGLESAAVAATRADLSSSDDEAAEAARRLRNRLEQLS